MAGKIFFITNMCTHYSIKLYELLSERTDIEYYFTGGEEPYWEKKNKKWSGNFKSEYLRGFFLLPKFRITPGLFRVIFSKYDILIKTIDDRFALPLTFLCAKILRRPFIFWVGLWKHPQTFFHKVSFIFTKMIYNHSDAIVVYGKHIKKYLMAIGVDENKIFCAPHAVDNSLFNKNVSSEDKKRIRLELGVTEEKVLLYVGRLEPCKGLEYLIKAVADIRDVENIVIFIGAGAQRDSLEVKCRELNVKSKFLEFIPNDKLYWYYAVADIFILPSITTSNFKEPWGLVVNEAMNQGCPVIATDAVGAAAGGLVENGQNGFIVPEKNSEALRSAIYNLVSDEPLRLKMSSHSREGIKQWTQENMVEGFIQAIEYLQKEVKGVKENKYVGSA